jgi:hypothetical protein
MLARAASVKVPRTRPQSIGPVRVVGPRRFHASEDLRLSDAVLAVRHADREA